MKKYIVLIVAFFLGISLFSQVTFKVISLPANTPANAQIYIDGVNRSLSFGGSLPVSISQGASWYVGADPVDLVNRTFGGYIDGVTVSPLLWTHEQCTNYFETTRTRYGR